MAGNVAQWTVDYPDPATMGYKYRVEDFDDLEHTAMGGSWAKSKSYLRCGDRVCYSPGNRHPDLGFRPVRQPVGSDWSLKKRKLCAVSLGEGQVLLELGTCRRRHRRDAVQRVSFDRPRRRGVPRPRSSRSPNPRLSSIRGSSPARGISIMCGPSTSTGKRDRARNGWASRPPRTPMAS